MKTRNLFLLGIGDWGLGPIPKPQYPQLFINIYLFKYNKQKNFNIQRIFMSEIIKFEINIFILNLLSKFIFLFKFFI